MMLWSFFFGFYRFYFVFLKMEEREKLKMKN